MTEQLPVETSSGWFAEWAANGKIPGAVKAIARLVGASADAGTAWIDIVSVKGEQIQQAIKDETAAKTAMSKALTKAASTHAVNDAALVERAVEQWAGKRLRSQANREAIAVLTVEHLKEGDQFENTTDAPSDDWINIFEHFAEQASSEKLRDTWARVLAGEIRKPGSFSHRTLQLVSILDQKLAGEIEHIFGKVCNGRFVFHNAEISGKELDMFCNLQDVGLLRFNDLAWIATPREDSNMLMAVFKKTVVVAYFNEKQKISITSAIISPVALELIQIVTPFEDEQQILLAAQLFKEQGAIKVGRCPMLGDMAVIGQLIEM